MAMNRIKLEPHEELRSELIRLYPEQDQHPIMNQLLNEVQQATNYIIQSRIDTKRAVVAYAIKNNLVTTPPAQLSKPPVVVNGTKEETEAAKQQWKDYREQKKAFDIIHSQWLDSVFVATKAIPECSWRNETYQEIGKKFAKLGSSILYRDLVARIKKTKRAKLKRSFDHIPLVYGNSEPIAAGEFYGNRRGIPWYNALVKVPMKGAHNTLYLKGRLRRPLPGRPVQGVTLIKKSDGWYAAIKCVVDKRIPPKPTLGPIGVDVGQTDLVALSNGYIKHNDRDGNFKDLKSELMRKGDTSGDINLYTVCRSKCGRLDLSAKRRMRHWLNSELIPMLSRHEVVFVENLEKGFRHETGPVSTMHIILNQLKSRLGDRVVEVESRYSSQECSACGHIDANARKGKIYCCTNLSCNLIMDADVNAAKVVLKRGLKLKGVQTLEPATSWFERTFFKPI